MPSRSQRLMGTSQNGRLTMQALSRVSSVAAVTALILSAQPTQAKDWWPFPITAAKDGDLKKVEQIEYTPLPKAEKPWNLCVLYPHLQDSFWVSVNYGLIEEAKRMGVKVSVFQ